MKRLRLIAAVIALVLCAACAVQPSAPAATIPQPSRISAATTSESGVSHTATVVAPAQPDTFDVAPPPVATVAKRDPRLYPNPALTPGAVLPVTAAQVSVVGYASKTRDVPASEKREVFAEYGLAYPQKPGAYECDHFIPLCLGGSNSILNLWPEPAPEFHWKDGLEVYLWDEVRAHAVSLDEAQGEFRTNWYAFWVKDGRPGYTTAAAASAAIAPTPVARSGGGLIVGWSVAGKRYHLLTCRYFLEIKSANRRTGTVAQARAAGKTPCRVCDPPGS